MKKLCGTNKHEQISKNDQSANRMRVEQIFQVFTRPLTAGKKKRHGVLFGGSEDGDWRAQPLRLALDGA